ncbi:MAG: macrolide ABC transporter ATP-binding protein [Nitrospinae bacterium CG22_combo_CG10-13_8_21_14_all_47_10]|nr:MAG: macrolide ABC transporter ATP-binding protein [Nitrospinae bacterium CG22_combo_CG10-13_8_21_14_all_47_10]
MNSICKSYRNIGIETKVLQNVTLHIKEGDYVSIIGPSGAGKSTLMAIMGCLAQPTSGEYILDGEEVGKLNDRKLSRVRNEKIGFVFQAFHLLPGVTALENVMLPIVYAKNSQGNAKERARALLAKVGLEHRLHHTPGQLSGGEQQRVTIARSLINDPRIILADEPTGNLDSKNGIQTMQTFDNLVKEGKTIILITHDPAVAQHAGRIISILDGQIASDRNLSYEEQTRPL